MKTFRILILLPLFWLGGCQSMLQHDSLYDQLGGQPAIEKIVDNFIEEISFDPQIVTHFKDTNIDRLRTKLIEKLCNVSGGPCEYTGDSMEQVHHKMNITEAEFNRTVDLLINAMNKAGVNLRTQNRLLARLAPLREDIIYH